MFTLYKDLEIEYFLSTLFGMLAICVLFAFYKLNALVLVITVFIWIFACVYLFSLLATKRLSKTNMRRENKCNISSFIASYEKMLKNASDRKTRNTLLIYLSIGYLEIGNPTKALELLYSITPNFPDTSRWLPVKGVYYLCLGDCHFMMRDLKKAEEMLQCHKNVLDNPKLKKKDRDRQHQSYIDRTVMNNMARGDYDGAEKHFLLRLEQAHCLLQKVAANYWLSQIYLHEQKSEKANACLSFVAQNGGDTYHAQYARKMLGNNSHTL